MVKVKRGDCELYIDGWLKSNLDYTSNLVKDDWDLVGLYCGDEGAGKTVKAMQDALYLDPDFTTDNIVFNSEQFAEAVEHAPKYSAIMWDESDEMESQQGLNRIVLTIKRLFKRIRKNNLFILLVTPTFFDMNKYFIMHRISYLVHVYAEGGEEKAVRGFFRFYPKRNLRRLYLKGKKEWDLTAERPKFKGRFTKLPKNFPIDWEEYERKKDKATENLYAEAKSNRNAIAEYRRNCVARSIKFFEGKGYKIRHEDIGFIFGASIATIGNDLRVKREEVRH